MGVKMFNLGEKIRINTYDKEVEIFANIIEIRYLKGRTTYIVQFNNGNVRTYFEEEILKID